MAWGDPYTDEPIDYKDCCGVYVTKALNKDLSAYGSDKLLPSNNLGVGIPKFLSDNYGVPLLKKDELSLDYLKSLGPGTAIAMKRQPGDRNYEYGNTHAEVTAINPETGELMVASKSSGKNILWKTLDENYLNSLPEQTTASNPFAQIEKKANSIAASVPSGSFGETQGQWGEPIEGSFGEATNIPENAPEQPSIPKQVAQGITGAMAKKIPIIDMSTGELVALGIGGAVGGMAAGPPGAVAGAGLMYGAEQQAEKAFRNEPSTVMGTGEDILKGSAYQATGAVLEPFTKPVASWVGAKLKGLGRSLYERALKVPPSVDRKIRDKAVSTAMEGNITITREGIEKVEGKIQDFVGKVDDIIMSATNENKMVDVRNVLDSLGRVRGTYKHELNPKPIMDAIKEAENALKSKAARHNTMAPFTTQNYEIPVSEAQGIKERLHVKLKKYYNQMSGVEQEINKDIARGLRLELEKQIPELAAVNKDFGNVLSLEAILERAVNRTRNYELIRLGDMILATGGAAATGTIEGGFKAALVNHVLNNPKVMSKIGIMLNKSDSLTGKYLAKLLGYKATSDVSAERDRRNQ
jgi:hypothetical protein